MAENEKDTMSIAESTSKENTVVTKVEPRLEPAALQLDTGEEYIRYRLKWWQLWLPKDPPPPPRLSLSDAPITPVATASIISMLTYSWITPMMVLGYQRTLQAGDLWRLDEKRETAYLSGKLDDSWARRCQEADEWNAKLDSGELKPGRGNKVVWAIKSLGAGGKYSKRRAALEKHWREVDGKKEASLAWALNDTFGISFWLGGGFKVVGDTTQLMGPLVIRAIITFADERSTAKAFGTDGPSIGRGIGLAIAAFLVIITASICNHQFFWRSMTTGVLARAALIASIYKRGVNLTGKARTTITNASLVNHISTDVSRVDAAAQWFHAAWTAPIQVLVCLIILCVQLGPSALAGFSLFLLVIPLQRHIMAMQFKIRKKSMQWTDKRAKLLLEVLGGMRIVKYFSYEVPFLQRIFDVRRKELRSIWKIQNAFSFNMALSFSVPVFAATLAFVTYTLTAHGFNSAIIFSSLSLFQLLRQPLLFLPRALSAIPDARNALNRLSKVFHAEVMTDVALEIVPDQIAALDVKGIIFEWESDPSATEKGGKESASAEGSQGPFRVHVPEMTIKRGDLIAVVGPVGSGKSSLLQGLIGEMRKVTGHITFGGKVSYCPQTAWIQNATLRDNIVFGQTFEEERYWCAVENASLLPDLQVLADGDLTEIGEKGINLSGGQKQRVNIARALYFNADIVIMDDPLSAVDAHVGKALFHDAILGALRNQGTTVILVTHALHFLSQCDYIYVMSNGHITEAGNYKSLIEKGGDFARLDKAFGGASNEDSVEDVAEGATSSAGMARAEAIDAAKMKSKQSERTAGTGKLEGRLIVKERRTVGTLSWGVYGAYLKAGNGWVTLPLVIFFLILMQGSQVLNSYTLVWWQENEFNRPTSFYQILYACLGIAQFVFTVTLGTTMDFMSLYVSRNLHHSALRNIFYAPMSFFDTTPTGRILGVLQKDIDTIDNQLAVAMRMFALVLAIVAGSVIIISILEYYFLVAIVFIVVLYCYFAAFYRASARETKRLDSMLRSILYSHFAESLSGLPTIRSYGELTRFIKDNFYYVDLEDRALFLTVTNQRWLAIRLDFLGACMVFLISIFTVTGVTGISPAQIGLVLTYTTQLSQMCGFVTRQSAEVENYMNSVERVVHYSKGNLIDQEAPHDVPAAKPPSQWPAQGAIEFKDIVMSYRPGLPNVLNNISLHVQGGEKIGVVGRTGAGKSSLLLALFRIIEPQSGSIEVDGVDISKIGLKDLRTKISIIPQDPLLFSGTIRSNLDPFDAHEDARLRDALHRSYLTQTASGKTPDEDTQENTGKNTSRFSLDTVIESEGANLSVGERSLLSLARALVKDSRVIVLDEATASVDLETDSKIQRTIQTQFADRTLLCIAHRLRTIISYDKICVMDAGKVVEFDSPTALFIQGGVFHSMCEQSNITLDDIHKSSVTI